MTIKVKHILVQSKLVNGKWLTSTAERVEL